MDHRAGNINTKTLGFYQNIDIGFSVEDKKGEVKMDPYNAGGDPNHPGVSGKPFAADPKAKASPEVVPGQKIDVTGTGTFAPEQQGNVGRTQPAGLSGSVQYGEATPGQVPGDSDLVGPQTGPERVQAAQDQSNEPAQDQGEIAPDLKVD